MMIYLLKAIACSAIFLLVYLLFLEKEKIHLFNRFYLLFSLLAAFLIPLVVFKQFELVTYPMVENLLPATDMLSQVEIQNTNSSAEKSGFSMSWYLLIYAIISSILFIRFGLYTFFLLSKILKNRTIKFSTSTLVLIDNQLVPHSFLHYIFINKNEFEKRNFPEEILVHEKAHVEQKHSVDVLLIELIIIFFWFNPFLYLYRKAIKLNHEFLADEAVVQHTKSIKTYQSLLIKNIKKTQGFSFASQLNFSITKKRFMMMTKTKSSGRILLKQIALIPVFVLLLFLFSEKIIAQKEVVQDQKEMAAEKTSVQKATKGKDDDEKGKFSFYAPATDEGATDQQMLEYASIVKKYKSTDDKSWWKAFRKNISTVDHKKLESIFLQMNRDQQKQQRVVFIKSMPNLPKKVPTPEQIESWKDPKMYGVWIDDKRVDNAILENYQANDFSHLFVSKLYKNAKNYGKHYYQVDLMTNEHFAGFNAKKELEKDIYRMVFHFGSSYTIVNN